MWSLLKELSIREAARCEGARVCRRLCISSQKQAAFMGESRLVPTSVVLPGFTERPEHPQPAWSLIPSSYYLEWRAFSRWVGTSLCGAAQGGPRC